MSIVCDYQGIPLLIEYRKGDVRTSTDRKGKVWKRTMLADYGEIAKTKGTDGDKIDIFLLSETPTPMVYVVNQRVVSGPRAGAFDEQKCILGATSTAQASAFYRRQYPDPAFFGGIHALPLARFKALLRGPGRRGERLRKAIAEEKKMQRRIAISLPATLCLVDTRVVLTGRLEKAISAPYLQPSADWKPRVTTRPDQVRQEKFGAEKQFTSYKHAVSGASLRGTPIAHSQVQASPLVYHVTPFLNEIGRSGHLRASGSSQKPEERSLGGNEGADFLSFTKDRHHAVNLHRDMVRMGKLSRGEHTIHDVGALAEEDERHHNLPKGSLAPAVQSAHAWHQDLEAENGEMHPGIAGVGGFARYLEHRKAIAAQHGKDVRDPHFRGAYFDAEEPNYRAHKMFQHIHAHNTGIVAVPSRNLPQHAYMQHIPHDMDEIQVHGDVPLHGAKFVTNADHTPLHKAADAGITGSLPPMVTLTHPTAQHAEARQATDSQQEHSHNGIYHPDRAAIHDKIVHHFLHGGEHADLHSLYGDYAKGDGQKRAVFTAGGGGSGKSYYAHKKFLKHPRFALVDPDAIKEHLAAHEGRPGHHNTHAAYYHEESSDIAKRLHGEALAHGKNFVYDGTGANAPSLAKKIQQSKASGYHVSLHYAKVPLHVALERNQNRARKVPEDVLIHQHSQVADSIRKVSPLADRVKVVDTSTPQPSALTQQRVQKQETLRIQGRLPLQKGLDAMSDIHAVQTIRVKPGHLLKGKIIKGMVHVEDVIHHGVSERHLTGHAPALHPIPWARLEAMGAKVVPARHSHTGHIGKK